MNPSNEETWIVVVEPDHSLESLRAGLEGLGFRVQQALTAVGVLVARGSSEQAVQARKLPGVVDVSPDFEIDIGPPDAEVS